MKEGFLRIGLRFRFDHYIRDILVFGTDKRKECGHRAVFEENGSSGNTAETNETQVSSQK